MCMWCGRVTEIGLDRRHYCARCNRPQEGCPCEVLSWLEGKLGFDSGRARSLTAVRCRECGDCFTSVIQYDERTLAALSPTERRIYLCPYCHTDNECTKEDYILNWPS